MAFNEDINLFFDETNGFAVLATFKGVTISTIIDDDFYAASGEEVDIAASKVVAHCRSVDVPGVVQGDSFEVLDGDHAGDFVITNVRPDGTGVTILDLQEV